MRALLAAATCFALALTCVAAPRFGPAVPYQSHPITGRVVADDTGDPIGNARVAARVPGQETLTVVLTDRDGRFSFDAVEGRVTVTASKTGFARREETLAAPRALELRLPRAAVVSGRVIDELGDPVVNARVFVETLSPKTAAASAVAATMTDDAGEYRVAGLSRAAVAVAVQTQAATGLPGRKTYYPAVETAAAAEHLQLEPGAEKAGIDFVLPAPQPEPPALVMGPGNQLVPAPRLAAGSGTVRGRVVATDGRAIAHARLLLMSYNSIQWQGAIADGDGSFEVRDLPAGRFRLRVMKPGYWLISPDRVGGHDLTSELLFDLAEGETRDRITLGLAQRHGVTGRILDETGDPLQGATVSVMQVRYEAGRRRLVPVATSMRVTDDLGRYRLFGLEPGRYVVSAAIGGVFSEDLPGYARTYFPGTPSAGEAQFVAIGTTQDVTGIDFAMARVRTARIAGRAINAAGEPVTGGLTLFSSRASAVSTSYGARILPDGTFEFPNIPPGQYVIQAYRGRSNPSTEGEFGAMSVSVDGRDVSGLTLQTAIGARIRGRVRLDASTGTKPPPALSIAVSAIPVDFDLAPGLPAVAEVGSNEAFELNGISGSRRLQLVRTPDGWTLSAIRVNGVDVTDRALQFGTATRVLDDVEVVLSDRVSELALTVLDDRQAPVPAASVVVFSTTRDDWYPESRFVRRATAGSDGMATVRGLPSGTYSVVALPAASADDGAWEDPAFLSTVAALATMVTVTEGQKQTQALKVSPRPR